MNCRRWGLALLLLGWTQVAWSQEPPKASERPEDKGKQPAKAQPIQIPYRLTNTQHILVRAKINGKGPFNFIVDTGAPILIFATEPAKKLGLNPGAVKLDRLEIEGGAVLEKFPCLIETPFQIEGMNGIGLPGRELHGMMGYTVLSKFHMEIDLTKEKMVWTPLNYDPPPPKGSGGGGGHLGLEMMGKMYKVLGFMMGAKTTPDMVGRGFVGIELHNGKGNVAIAAVLSKSPAAEAGLKVGDQIVQINGKTVSSADDVLRLTAEAVAGQAMQFVVRRGGEKLNIRLITGDGL